MGKPCAHGLAARVARAMEVPLGSPDPALGGVAAGGCSGKADSLPSALPVVPLPANAPTASGSGQAASLMTQASTSEPGQTEGAHGGGVGITPSPGEQCPEDTPPRPEPAHFVDQELFVQPLVQPEVARLNLQIDMLRAQLALA